MHAGLNQLKTIKQYKNKKGTNPSKSPQRDFELLYRERDDSVEKHPIENIIFVKSKRCRPDQKVKRTKVKDEFRKIMKDLDNHVSKHKKSPSQTHIPNQISSKPNKNETSCVKSKQNPTLKKNKQQDEKQNTQNPRTTTIKSPKCLKSTNIQSPNRKHILGAKSPKGTKSKSRQKINRNGAEHNISKQKSNLRSTINSNSINDKTVIISKKSHKFFALGEADQTKKNTSNNLQILPLNCKGDEYILLEGNFKKTSFEHLNKLETKLLSTYRVHKYEEKISSKKSSYEVTANHSANIPQNERDSMPWLSDDEPFVFQGQVQEESANPIQSIQAFFQKRIIVIQRWWRQILSERHKNEVPAGLDCLSEQDLKSCRIKEESQSKIEDKIVLVLDHVPHYPSAESLEFGQVDSEGMIVSKTFAINREMTVDQQKQTQISQNKTLKRSKAIQLKRQAHEQILKKLLSEQSISPQVYAAKMRQIIAIYEQEMQSGIAHNKNTQTKTDNKNTQTKTDRVYHLKQEETAVVSTNISGVDFSHQSLIELSVNEQVHLVSGQEVYEQTNSDSNQWGSSPVNEQEKQFVMSRKKTQGCHFTNNEEIAGRYKKHTTSQGDEYYEEVSDCSNDNSPHKALNFCEEHPVLPAGTVSPEEYDNSEMNKLFSDFREIQGVKMCIQRRVSIQMGSISEDQEDIFSVNTSIIGIHEFLVHFFKFYLHNYKDEFLRLINMPYGYSPSKRLQFLQGYEDESDSLVEDEQGIIYGLQYIISDEVLQEFFDSFYGSNIDQQLNESEKQIINYTKIHAKAAFDCFNQALNSFRPYFSIGGPPYMWNCSENALTFYFISQDNLGQVFEKTQYKVLKWASSLVGLIVPQLPLTAQLCSDHQDQASEVSEGLDAQSLICKYRSGVNPILLQNRDERATKDEHTEVIEGLKQWSILEEQKTSVLYEVSSLLLEQLALEIARELQASRH